MDRLQGAEPTNFSYHSLKMLFEPQLGLIQAFTVHEVKTVGSTTLKRIQTLSFSYFRPPYKVLSILGSSGWLVFT